MQKEEYRKHARIHVYTGEGEGKTTTALGLALRAVGHKHKVVIVQFMKGRKFIGEYKIMKRLKPEYKIYQFGREDFIYDIKHPLKEDYELARKGLEFAKKVSKKKINLLILEEINLAINIGLLKLEDILKFLKETPKDLVVVLTGRRANKKLIEIADLVTEMKLIKHPFEKGIFAKEGVEY